MLRSSGNSILVQRLWLRTTRFALPVFKAPIPAGTVQSPPMPLPAKFGGIIDYPSPARVAAPELHSRRCHDGSSPAYGRARISESSRLGLQDRKSTRLNSSH